MHSRLFPDSFSDVSLLKTEAAHAFANKDYDTALACYQKVLSLIRQTQNNEHILACQYLIVFCQLRNGSIDHYTAIAQLLSIKSAYLALLNGLPNQAQQQVLNAIDSIILKENTLTGKIKSLYAQASFIWHRISIENMTNANDKLIRNATSYLDSALKLIKITPQFVPELQFDPELQSLSQETIALLAQFHAIWNTENKRPNIAPAAVFFPPQSDQHYKEEFAANPAFKFTHQY